MPACHYKLLQHTQNKRIYKDGGATKRDYAFNVEHYKTVFS